MSRPSPHPELTPQFCFNQTALRDFLRLSRATIDDSISQNLNALLHPSRPGFDPSSTSRRQVANAGSSRTVAGPQCAEFKQRVLFPSWEARSNVLEYCAGVATSPDPNDPDHITRQIEDAKERERVVDERLDPYSGRYFPKEARTESLAMLMRNERAVEKIVRERSWGVVEDRCENATGESAEAAFAQWRAGKERTR